MSALAPSRYNVLVPLRHGRALAYNTLTAGLGVWEAEDCAAYAAIEAGGVPDPSDPVVGALLHGGFVVGAGVDELKLLEQRYKAQRYAPGNMVLTIAPTLSCNFGCDYCFQGQDKPRDTMSPEVQDATVALVEGALPKLKHLHVAWYGGEPLLRRGVVEALSDRLIAACDAAGVGYDAMAVSNGYLLSAETARSLHARRVRTIQVTLDGAPNYHDQRRALLSGKPTFARIAENLKAAAEAAPITLSIRVNIDERNRAEIHGLLDWLADNGLAGRPNLQVYFAPVEAMTEGCHTVSDVTMTKLDYGSLEAELTRHAFERGLVPLPFPPKFRGICGAVRPKGFVILPSGDVHKCWDTVNQPERAVGTVFDVAALAASETARAWNEWTPFRHPSCRSCKLLPTCAGACAFKFLHPEQQRGEAALPCPSWKYNLHERLLLRAEKMGALAAEDVDPVLARTNPAALCLDPVEALAAK